MTEEMTREKAEFYLSRKTNIHIKKENGQFYNGLIIECSDTHLIILDRVLGEIFVSFSEIKKVEPYKTEGE